MCIFSAPKIPPMPEARPIAPIPEKTAEAPVLGKKRATPKARTGGRPRRSSGVSSLRIPTGSRIGSGDLNY